MQKQSAEDRDQRQQEEGMLDSLGQEPRQRGISVDEQTLRKWRGWYLTLVLDIQERRQKWGGSKVLTGQKT